MLKGLLLTFLFLRRFKLKHNVKSVTGDIFTFPHSVFYRPLSGQCLVVVKYEKDRLPDDEA